MAYNETLNGELDDFSFIADDGSFAVARIRREEGGLATAVGPIGHLTPGTFVRLEGRWSTHAKFGKRFQVRSLLIEDPRTLRGLEKYLASGAVKGLGAELAKRTVEAFGLETLRILDEEPERLREVNGIGKKRHDEIVAHWEREKAGRELTILLRGHGLGAAVANRILDRFGDSALSVVTRNPYRLAGEIPGVAFRTADAIARGLGIGKEDPRRAEAALEWLLSEAGGQGHCYLPHRDLVDRARNLEVGPVAVDAALQRKLLEARLVIRDGEGSERRVYRAEVDRREAGVAARLRAATAQTSSAERFVAMAEARVGLTLNDDQRKAVQTALEHGVSVVTGGPGTGKTTIVRVLMEAADLRKERWALAAPTGRAARRLAESCGKEGKTIHRLLEYSMQTMGFTRGLDKPLEVDGVLVDEASMMDLELTESLLNALPARCKLVLVGDADQLPSVGAGSVLGDLIASGEVPVAALKQVYRQAQDSGIIRNAWRVQKGEVPVSSEKEAGMKQDFFVVGREGADQARATLIQIVAERLKAKGFDPLTDVQVLTPMHRGPLGSQILNQELQQRLNPDGQELVRGGKRLRVNDRVICVRNDYDNDVFNGDVGRVASVLGGTLTVDFDGRRIPLVGDQLDQVELAYAISIHKSQGSEYPAVVMALHTGHHIMLRRNLLYTGMTRAQRFCCVVGSWRAVRRAVEQEGGTDRWTGLADRLRAQPG